MKKTKFSEHSPPLSEYAQRHLVDPCVSCMYDKEWGPNRDKCIHCPKWRSTPIKKDKVDEQVG